MKTFEVWSWNISKRQFGELLETNLEHLKEKEVYEIEVGFGGTIKQLLDSLYFHFGQLSLETLYIARNIGKRISVVKTFVR